GWRLGDWDASRLLAHFQEWGFHRFADQVRVDAREVQQGVLFALDAVADDSAAPQAPQRPQASWGATFHLVDTPAKFEPFLKELKKQKRFALDLETTGLQPRQSAIVGYAFCWREGEAWYLAVRGPAGEPVLDPDKTLAALRP